jgi:hypothetical protein
MIGDRAYSNPSGVARVAGAGGDALIRPNWQTLSLYHEDGRKMNIPAALRRLRVGELCNLPVWVRPATGDALPGRLIAVRRSAAATRQVVRKMEMQANKKQTTVSAKSCLAAQYFTIWTNLSSDATSRQILASCRGR